jgi:hypothetical protein
VKRAGAELDVMKRLRNKADYDMKDRETETESIARRYIESGARVIADINAAFSGPDRDRIVEGIRDYRRKIGLP